MGSDLISFGPFRSFFAPLREMLSTCAIFHAKAQRQFPKHAKNFQVKPLPPYDERMKIKVVIHDAEEGGFWAEAPAIPGCATQGETFEELLQTSMKRSQDACQHTERDL
jgi:hypothetical protein